AGGTELARFLQSTHVESKCSYLSKEIHLKFEKMDIIQKVENYITISIIHFDWGNSILLVGEGIAVEPVDVKGVALCCELYIDGKKAIHKIDFAQQEGLGGVGDHHLQS
ncbi:hypothetical protein ACJX0J_036946, partial [Zea mays]